MIVVTVLAVGFVPSLAPEGLGQDAVTAFVDRGGKVVFTNLANYSPPAPTADNPLAQRLAPLDSLIENISSRHGVDPVLVRSVIEVESNFDRRAVSPKGAMGLMQLIPATGRRFGVRDFFDPAQNISGGVQYLRYLLGMFEGNLDLSLAAYNSGENRVARLGRIPQIRETQDYVQRVKSAYSRRGGQAATGASLDVETAESGARRIVSSVDDRGVLRFSNVE